MRVAFSVALAFLVACAHGAAPERQLEQWENRHPEAARELGEWVRRHPHAAGPFFDWDAQHPGAASEFVTWAIAHPHANVERFVGEHPNWMGFDRFAEAHRPASQEFLDWCRRHPRAAEDLVEHPGGLHWAGHHLYRTYWSMESGG